ncbi:unnamed protein product [Lupinus luteus]|uniref:Uncharacterized protein n=1 Tax=Lupinus luteus TaxID=3873 RepID=A0AAV1WSU4_LUPLU
MVEDKEVKITLALGNSTYNGGSRENVENGALKTDEQLVILMENVGSADAHFKKFLVDEFGALKLDCLENSFFMTPYS